jgi:hypothetical protein
VRRLLLSCSPKQSGGLRLVAAATTEGKEEWKRRVESEGAVEDFGMEDGGGEAVARSWEGGTRVTGC